MTLDLVAVRSDVATRLATITTLTRVRTYGSVEKTQFDDLPLAEIGPASFSLTEEEGALPELGFDEWTVEWPLSLYVNYSTPDVGEDQLYSLVASLFDAFSPSRPLASCVSSLLVSGEPTDFGQGRERATPIQVYNVTLRTAVKTPIPVGG